MLSRSVSRRDLRKTVDRARLTPVRNRYPSCARAREVLQQPQGCHCEHDNQTLRPAPQRRRTRLEENDGAKLGCTKDQKQFPFRPQDRVTDEVGSEDESSPRQCQREDRRPDAMDRSIKRFRNSKVIGIEPGIEKQADCPASKHEQADSLPPRWSAAKPKACRRGQCRHPEGQERRPHDPPITAQRVFADGVLGRIQVGSESMQSQDGENEDRQTGEAHQLTQGEPPLSSGRGGIGTHLKYADRLALSHGIWSNDQ